MAIQKLARKVLFLIFLLVSFPVIKSTSLLIHTAYYPCQPLLLAQDDSFDLDALQVRRVVKPEKPLSTWQLFLIKIGCSVVITTSNFYNYLALKLATINHYIASKFSTSTTSTNTNPVVDEHE